MSEKINIEEVNKILNQNLQNKEEIKNCKYCNQKLPCDRNCFELYLKNKCFFCSKIFRNRTDLDRHFQNKYSCLQKIKEYVSNENNKDNKSNNSKNNYEDKIKDLKKIITKQQNEIDELKKIINDQKKIFEEKETIKTTDNEEYLHGRFSLLFAMPIPQDIKKLFDTNKEFKQKRKKINIKITEQDIRYLMKKLNNITNDDNMISNIQYNASAYQSEIISFILSEKEKNITMKNKKIISQDEYIKKNNELVSLKKNLGKGLSNNSLKQLNNIDKIVIS